MLVPKSVPPTLSKNGNVPPVRVIQGSKTGFHNPCDVILDGHDRLVVSNRYLNTVERFPVRANGNVAPLNVLAGGNTQLSYPCYLYLAPQRNSLVLK